MQRSIRLVDLGVMRYGDALRLQRDTFEQVKAERLPDTLFLVEHPHVYTLGSQTDKRHLLYSPAELQARGIEVFEIERGGDITYHGYGQLVAYPILNLRHFYLDAHRYLRDLEETVIQTLKAFGVEGGRKTHPNPKKNYTGVWVGDEKICAIGVKFSSWTTMHGLALNVNVDLSYFAGIVPCGISEMGVTSLAKVLGGSAEMSRVKSEFARAFARVFQAEISKETLHGGRESDG
ncbi:MAG: lipoyl(octanoyl) transferase LipB [Chloroherpetonaceae bacterium]|nr:lipoyl(octanoyl) transferase LipB [Chloroherpetonaceae bacterium]MDW8438724.1 lipoyl(octanoyl) transferase LipB [Chloroherpetonaceae bacterium]